MAVPINSLVQSVGKSFSDSFGDIVFGMEDGTVSIFGLVFGVATSSTSSSIVLLAGATGAIAAAVSMMAGTYLDVSTTRDQAQAQIAHEKTEIEQKPEEEGQEVSQRLLAAGFTEQDSMTVLEVLRRTPVRSCVSRQRSSYNKEGTPKRIPGFKLSGCLLPI